MDTRIAFWIVLNWSGSREACSLSASARATHRGPHCRLELIECLACLRLRTCQAVRSADAFMPHEGLLFNLGGAFIWVHPALMERRGVLVLQALLA